MIQKLHPRIQIVFLDVVGYRIIVMDGLEKDSWINNYSRRIWWKANEIYHNIVD